MNYIYLNGSQYSWWTGTPHTITQAELDDYILFYGTTGVDCVISDIQIEKGTVATNYTPYKSFEVREYIITGQEFPTNRYVDGKRVYGKRINIGSLPNSKSVTFATGIPSNYVIDDVNARAIGTDDDKSFLKMPFSTGIVYSAWVRNDAYVLEVSTTDDRSLLNGIFDFYYTKN